MKMKQKFCDDKMHIIIDSPFVFEICRQFKFSDILEISNQNGCLIRRSAYFNGVLINACHFPGNMQLCVLLMFVQF